MKNRLFLSKSACRDLGVISENFPQVGNKDNVSSLNKCDLVNSNNPDSCKCPKRRNTPDPPEKIPFSPVEENIPRLKQFILDWYKDSAFNCCEQQPFPLMKGSPPMKLFADKNAKPVAFHKPFPIPLHWQEAVKQQLDNDVKMGVLAKVHGVVLQDGRDRQEGPDQATQNCWIPASQQSVCQTDTCRQVSFSPSSVGPSVRIQTMSIALL